MKVLMILNHAPDYREAFLRELGKYKNIDLTVVAQPCELDGLTSPARREGYDYIEINSIRFFGFSWQPGLWRVLRSKKWHVICVGANLRQLSSIALFITNLGYWNKWVWWGLIFGESKSRFVNLFKKNLFKYSAGCLVHSKAVLSRLQDEFNIKGMSYNNTEVYRNEFRPGNFYKRNTNIRMLFVGTYKPRKKLERLLHLASRRNDVEVRIVGTGMEKLKDQQKLFKTKKVDIYGRTTGDQLKPHFDWADIVVSPGSVGLLIMNAARHGKGIVIDNNSYHGPEFYLAKESGQPFISFSNVDEVDEFLERIRNNPSLFKKWGKALQKKAMEEYTIEYMTEVHVEAFEAVSSGKKLLNP